MLKNESPGRLNLLAGKFPLSRDWRELIRGISCRYVARCRGCATMMPMMMMMMMMMMVIMMAGGACLLVGDHRRRCLHVPGRFSPRCNLRDSGGAAGRGGRGGCSGRTWATGSGGGGGGGGTSAIAATAAAAAAAAAGGGWSRGETFATTPRRGGG